MSIEKLLGPITVVLGLLPLAAAATGVEYNTELFGDGNIPLQPTDLSESGVAVGVTYPSCFEYSEGKFNILPMPAGGHWCAWASIDRRGNKTITAAINNVRQAYRILPTGGFSMLRGIGSGESGVYASADQYHAGWSTDANGVVRAYLFRNAGAGVNVGRLVGDVPSYLFSVNKAGDALGYTYAPGLAPHTFVYSKGKITWVNEGTASGSWPGRLNDSGQAVGSSEGGPLPRHALRWKGNTYKAFSAPDGSSAWAADINNAGHIVGHYGPMDTQAMRIRNGVMTPLASLVNDVAFASWKYTVSVRINQAGVILGYGFVDGKSIGFLLRPVKARANQAE